MAQVGDRIPSVEVEEFEIAALGQVGVAHRVGIRFRTGRLWSPWLALNHDAASILAKMLTESAGAIPGEG